MTCKFTLLEAPAGDGKGYWDFHKQSDDRLIWLLSYLCTSDMPFVDRKYHLFSLLNGHVVYVDSCAFRLVESKKGRYL